LVKPFESAGRLPREFGDGSLCAFETRLAASRIARDPPPRGAGAHSCTPLVE
jgi:hypothetical protein